MVVYITIYILILIISLFVNQKSNIKRNWLKLLLIILILSLLGGLRAYTIGTDIKVYGQRWFETSCETSSFIRLINMYKSDYGYLFLNYLVSRFTSDFTIFLIILQLICNTLVIITIYRFRKESNFSMALTIYYFIYYFRNYNLLRQTIALAIIFFASYYLINNKNKKYILCVLIASVFHSTAIIGIIPVILEKIMKSNLKNKKIILLGIVLLTMTTILNIKPIIILLNKYGLINDRMYTAYVVKYYRDAITFNFPLLVIDIMLYIVPFIYMNFISGKNHTKKDNMLFSISTIDMITSQMGAIIKFSDRTSFYFGYMKMFIIPHFIKKMSANKNTKITLYMLTILVCMSYWYVAYVKQGYGQIIPYKVINR